MMRATKPITNSDDTIDSRDVIQRTEFLRGEWAEATGDDPDDYPVMSVDDWRSGLADDEAEELAALLELAEAGECLSDWIYGETLIRDSYFETYARELAEDIGAVNPDAGWPAYCIDWERAASDLLVDYTDIEFDGVTYWVRA